MRTALLAMAVAAAVSACASPALAHAERSASAPEEGSNVAAPPDTLAITFTEPPTGDAVVEVLDGCGNDVVTDVAIQNLEITATLSEGQPGDWTVRTNVISGIDGHNTRDRWAFDVRGKPDCSAAETEAPRATDGDEDDDEGGSAFPLIAIGAATAALIALALVVRGRSG